MRSPNPEDASPKGSPFVEVFRTVWFRIVKRSSKGAQRRFIQSIKDFCYGILAQVDVRPTASVPDIGEYLALRRMSVGTYPCFALIEYSHGLDIPDGVFEHKSIQAIRQIATDIMLCQNDILSYHKEQASGGNHNLIALCREEGMTQQEAYNRAGELLKDRYRAWYIAQSELPQWGEEVDVQVQKYIKGCQDTILANMNWSFKSERYFGKDNDVVRKTRIVKVLPQKSISAKPATPPSVG